MHLWVVVFAGIAFHYIKNVYTRSGAENEKTNLFQQGKVPTVPSKEEEKIVDNFKSAEAENSR